MKKVLLLFVISALSMLNIRAQDAPIDLYRAGTNVLIYSWDNNFTPNPASTTTGGLPVYEGSEHLQFDYDFSGYYAEGVFNISNWGSSLKNFSNHTHIVIAYKGSGAKSNTLRFKFTDNSSVTGATVTIASNSTASYKIDTIPLSLFKGSTALNLSTIREFNFSIAGTGGTGATGQFFIDNFQVIDLENVKVGATNIAPYGTYNFGNSNVGTATSPVTFTIENYGTQSLTLSTTPKIAISGTNASDFTINETLTTSPLIGGTSTTYTVSFNPSATGTRTAAIAIANKYGTYATSGSYVINLTGTGLAPEINVKAGATSIASSGSFDFGSSLKGTGTAATTFTIENLGTADLTISGTTKIAISGANQGDFTIDETNITSPVAASGTTNFTIVFNPSATGSRTAAITITNDDTDESGYVINLTGTGTAPEINVKAGATGLASSGTFDFGSSVQGTATSATTFTIENLGTSDLTISGTTKIVISGVNQGDFTIDETIVSSSVAASGTTSFTIVFNPSATGSRTAAITITNDDTDESSYVINLTGTGTASPEPEINVKAGANNVVSAGSFDFGSSLKGTATAATTFTIENIGTADLTISGATKIVISGSNQGDFIIDETSVTSPVAASGTTSFTIVFNPSATGSRTASITITNDDTDESSYVINLTGTGTAPEINVKAGATSVASSGSVDFGNSIKGTATAATTFTIENIGTSDLTISGATKIVISGANQGDFIIDETNVTSPVAASGTTSFTIVFNPSATGSRTAAITISNDDSDEGTYVIDLIGTGTVPEINLKAGATSIASSGSFDFGSSLKGTATAATTFTIENLGTADLTISGATKIAISGANQGDFTIDETNVTSPVAASGTTSFTIVFNPSATGSRTAAITITNDDSDEGTYVIDLIGTGTVPEINVKAGATSIASSGSFDFGSSLKGTATAATTFTIENLGTADLTISGATKIAISGSNQGDFTIDETSVTSPVAASTTTSFTIVFNPSATGSRTAAITITNDDSDEGTYVINLTGTGTAPEINVKAGATGIASSGTFDFGSSVQGTATSSTTFTIENLGTSDLTISGTTKIVISGANQGDFIIDETNLSSPISASSATTFTITFNPSAVGVKAAVITISNDDSDEGTYVINLTGTGTVTGLFNSSNAGTDTHIAYPTPFANETVVKINSTVHTPMSIKVLNDKGVSVYTSEGHFTNEDIIIGKELSTGVYFVQVTYQDRMQVIKIVKM